jgi:predicted RNA methylase
MNAQSKIDQPGQAIATLANIKEICEGRDKAIAHWLAAYDAFHAETMAAARACIGRAYFTVRDDRNGRGELAEAFAVPPDKPRDQWTGTEYDKTPARDHFAKIVTRDLDRNAWEALLDLTGARDLMDRQAKDESREGLKDPAPFTMENCAATFGHLWGNRRELFLRGIANAFSRLDRRFRSHDGFKVGSRLIIERAMHAAGWSSTHWQNHERRDTFEDVERLLYELNGTPYPSRGAKIEGGTPRQALAAEAISGLAVATLPQVIQGDFFRVRVFKNGNLHIWFERPDLLEQVNRLLSEYYGEALGDAHNETEAESAPAYHVTPAKKFGAFNTSPKIAAKVCEYASIGKETRVLEPSAGTGELAKAARERGAIVQCVELQPGLAHELATVHGFRNAYCRDFLQMTPADLGQFDVVLMNPPFDRGRDCDHVRHAWQFVKPGGRLVAIMAARAEFGEDARHKALHRIIERAESCYGSSPWHDLPPGSFSHAGTMVNTVVLTLRKPRA